ncbi:MerR family transcriptional regulator, partial [Klebsiella pneumoniae]
KPVKRRGNRRYYQHHEVLLIRRIRELLYEQGFTISGARNKLDGTHEAEQPQEPQRPVISLDEAAIDALRTELQAVLETLKPGAAA